MKEEKKNERGTKKGREQRDEMKSNNKNLLFFSPHFFV